MEKTLDMDDIQQNIPKSCVALFAVFMIVFCLAGSCSMLSSFATSSELVQFIERHEGFSGAAYAGPEETGQNATPNTIGYGHLIETGEHFTTLTQQQAQDLLINDLKSCIASVQKEFSGCGLSQCQLDALADFAYNLGNNYWPKAHVLVADIKTHAVPDKLKADFEIYDHIHSAVSNGLKKRRDDEWKLFCYGDYGLDPGSGSTPYGFMQFDWPIEGVKTYISCPFGMRTNPVTHKNDDFHEGIDIAGAGENINNHPIVAAADGTVSKIVTGDQWYGNYIVVDHGTGVQTFYGHCSSFATGMAVGKQVKLGDTIAFVGSTGNSTGPHLHFGVLVNSGYVDPQLIPYANADCTNLAPAG